MKKISQQELLDEGFWDGFKPKNWGKVARGAVRMGADALRMVAPEITNPLDKVDQARWGLKNSFEQGYEGIPDTRQLKSDLKQQITSNVAAQVYNDIKIGLAGQKMQMIPRFGVEQHGVDSSNGNRLYKVKVSSSQNPKGVWMLVDKKGNQSR